MLTWTEDESRLHDLVRICLRHLKTPESMALQHQSQTIRGFRTIAPRIWQVDLDGHPIAKLPDGPLPSRSYYLDGQAEIGGEILIWAKNGKIDSLELPWFSDAMPREIPRTSQVAFEE